MPAKLATLDFLELKKKRFWKKLYDFIISAPKICRSWMLPFPISCKKWFSGHISGCLCKWLDWIYPYEDFPFHFTSYFVDIDGISEYSCEFFCISLTCFILIYHSSLLFVWKPFRFINHVLWANESFLNDSNFPSSVYLFCATVYIYISMSTFLIFPVISVRIMRLKCNTFDADIGIQIM